MADLGAPAATTEFGVAFCTGGGFFLVGGVLLFFDRAM